MQSIEGKEYFFAPKNYYKDTILSELNLFIFKNGKGSF